MSLDDLLNDISALGGLPFYLVATITFLLLGLVGSFWHLLIGLVISYAIIAGVRSIFIRDRPKPVQYRTWWEKIDAGTAISMHSMRATVLGVILMQAFKNIWVTSFLIIVVLLVASTRFLLKKHYLIDCIWGVVLGAVVGTLILWAA